MKVKQAKQLVFEQPYYIQGLGDDIDKKGKYGFYVSTNLDNSGGYVLFECSVTTGDTNILEIKKTTKKDNKTDAEHKVLRSVDCTFQKQYIKNERVKLYVNRYTDETFIIGMFLSTMKAMFNEIHKLEFFDQDKEVPDFVISNVWQCYVTNIETVVYSHSGNAPHLVQDIDFIHHYKKAMYYIGMQLVSFFPSIISTILSTNIDGDCSK